MVNNKLKKKLEEEILFFLLEQKLSDDSDAAAEQPGSGPPAFGLPPSGQGTPKDMWGRKKPKVAHSHEKQKFLKEMGMPISGLGHIKKLWKFTKPQTNEYFVVTGPRNYGEPVGPGTGPSPMEYKCIPKKSGKLYTIEIQQDGKTIHKIQSEKKESLTNLLETWLDEQTLYE